LLSSNREIAAVLDQLVRRSAHAAFAVAWASADATPLRALIRRKHIIEHGVIGTHFYQTDPEALRAFCGEDSVRAVRQSSGVFHPKAYVFWDDKEWHVIIGSANLTMAAETANVEVMLHVRGYAGDGDGLQRDVRALIATYWTDASPIDEAFVDRYAVLWRQRKPVLKKLAGEYGVRSSPKPTVDSGVLTMSWRGYVEQVKRDRTHGYEERCGLLALVQEAFLRTPSFADMDDGVRRTIAGIPGASDKRWAWFGAMGGAGRFKSVIGHNDAHISAALDEIPKHGLVTKAEFNAYVEEFAEAFPAGGWKIATVTRLAAMKRPDQFVCLDSKNRVQLCQNFGIPPARITVETYWDEIVERIMDAPWWTEPRPRDPVERQLHAFRAAMLDAIFYKG
jgi:hypothetical protein